MNRAFGSLLLIPFLAACASQTPPPVSVAPPPAPPAIAAPEPVAPPQPVEVKPAPLADLVKAVDIPFESFTLANGLTVLVNTDRKAPVVGVTANGEPG